MLGSYLICQTENATSGPQNAVPCRLRFSSVNKYGCVCMCTYVCMHACMHACMYACVYDIYIYGHPPTTRTPLKNTVNTDANAVFFESNSGAVSTDWKHKCKTQKSKNPKIQKPKNPKIKKQKNKNNSRFRRCKNFWIFGMLDFWMLVFWNLRLVDICAPGTAFPCTVGARVR